MQKTKWFVITGAPCSGKTSVINQLNKMGYQVSDEVARNYINELLKNPEPDNNHDSTMKLQRAILAKKLKRERRLPADRLIFFDRGLPDSIAYYQLKALDDQKVRALAKKRRYNRVFMFDRLPLQQDPVRQEDEQTAKRLDYLIRKAYVSVGYDVIRVPVMPVEQRIKLILSYITE